MLISADPPNQEEEGCSVMMLLWKGRREEMEEELK
jgi:hypothetical protein